MSRFAISNRHVILLIILGALAHVIIYSYSNAQRFTYSVDLVSISGFLHNFSSSLREGNFYPRWMGEAFGSGGAPVFVYYSPLAYFIGSIFMLPASVDPHSIYQLGLMLGMGLGLASFTAYLWLKTHTGIPVAGIIALLLLALPSQFKNVHMNMSYAQLWATVWFPLGLICIEHWREHEDRRFLWGLSGVLALIILTHIPSAILFWPMLALYACFFRPLSWRVLAELAFAFLLALGISAIYIMPISLNWRAIQMVHYLRFVPRYDDLFIAPYDDRIWMYFVPSGLLETLPFLPFACIALWLNRKKDKADSLQPAIWLACIVSLGASLFFMPISKPIWEGFFLSHLLQGPFRFYNLFFVLTPILLLSIKRQVSWRAFIVIVCLALTPTWLIIYNQYIVTRALAYRPTVDHMMQMCLDSQSVANEHKTRWMPEDTSPGYFLSYDTIARVTFMQGEGTADMREWKNERLAFHISAKTTAAIQLKQHYYPAWQAVIDGQPVALRPNDAGFMVMNVPEGEHEVLLTFAALDGEKLGEVISLISLFILVILMQYANYKRKSPTGQAI